MKGRDNSEGESPRGRRGKVGRSIDRACGASSCHWGVSAILGGFGVFHGDLGFTVLTAALASSGRVGGVAGCFVEPADHGAVGGKLWRFAVEEDEDGLGDILGEMRIAKTPAG